MTIPGGLIRARKIHPDLSRKKPKRDTVVKNNAPCSPVCIGELNASIELGRECIQTLEPFLDTKEMGYIKSLAGTPLNHNSKNPVLENVFEYGMSTDIGEFRQRVFFTAFALIYSSAPREIATLPRPLYLAFQEIQNSIETSKRDWGSNYDIDNSVKNINNADEFVLRTLFFTIANLLKAEIVIPEDTLSMMNYISKPDIQVKRQGLTEPVQQLQGLYNDLYEVVFNSNYKYLIGEVTKFTNRSARLNDRSDELLQAAYSGFFEALETFDLKKDCKFLSWLAHKVLNSLQQEQKAITGIPHNYWTYWSKITKCFARLRDKLDREPRLEDAIRLCRLAMKAFKFIKGELQDELVADELSFDDALDYCEDRDPESIETSFARYRESNPDKNTYIPASELLKKVYKAILRTASLDEALHEPDGDADFMPNGVLADAPIQDHQLMVDDQVHEVLKLIENRWRMAARMKSILILSRGLLGLEHKFSNDEIGFVLDRNPATIYDQSKSLTKFLRDEFAPEVT